MKRALCLLALLTLLTTPATASVSDAGGALQLPLQIAPDLPATTLTLTQIGETMGKTGETLYTYRLSVHDPSDRLHVPDFDVESELTLDLDALIVPLDLNFDGYLDLDIVRALHGSSITHRFFLWDTQTGAFVAAELGNLARSWYTLYPESAIIHGYTSDAAATGKDEIYQWQNGGLTLLRSMQTRDVDEGKAYHTLITDYSDGAKRILTDETQQFDSYISGFASREATLWEGLNAGDPLIIEEPME